MCRRTIGYAIAAFGIVSPQAEAAQVPFSILATQNRIELPL
jgi:hypothetical protein